MSNAGRTFVVAHMQLRMREMPLVGSALVLLAVLGVLVGFGLQWPERFASSMAGRSAGLASFLGTVYHPWAVVFAMSCGSIAALAGRSAHAGSGLEESLSGTRPGASLRPVAEALATVVVCLVFALVPLPLQLWAWRLGVVEPAMVGSAAGQLLMAGCLAALVVSLARRVLSSYGARLQLALVLEWGLVLLVFAP